MQLRSGQIDLRVAYQQALEYGDLTEDQFNYLIAKLEAEEIVDPSAPVEVAEPVPGGTVTDPEDGDGDGVSDEGKEVLEEMFRTAGLELASGDMEVWRGNGKH
jgi:hypothetical protein